MPWILKEKCVYKLDKKKKTKLPFIPCPRLFHQQPTDDTKSRHQLLGTNDIFALYVSPFLKCQLKAE